MVITCGRNSRISRTSGSAASSTGTSAKQPSGSGGLGSPSGQPESTKPSQSWRTPRISRAASISWRRISEMFSSTSGRSIFGFRIDPRSPPVQVTTWTSTPSATYFAVLAAPLLDSSSGWAWTCMRRNMRSILEWGGDRPRDPIRNRTPVTPTLLVAASAVLAAVFLGWLVWVILYHGRPLVQSGW